MASKNYKHVDSKVRKYIQEIKAADEAARRRRRSADPQPETTDQVAAETARNAENIENNNVADEARMPYDELLARYNDALEEIKFMQKAMGTCEKVDIKEGIEISLINDSDLQTILRSHNSTICSEDFSIEKPRVSIEQVVNRPRPSLYLNVESPKRQPKPKSLAYICRSTTKKVLRKFSCAGEVKKENELHPLMTMRRVETPKVGFARELSIRNTSTPGVNLRRKIFHSAKKVTFQARAENEDQRTTARRLIQNLDEVKDFLASM